MTLFLTGLALFIGVHLTRVFVPAVRAGIIDRFGEFAWKGPYSLISLGALMLLGQGYTAAYGTTPLLYDVPGWGRTVPLVAMAAAFVLAIASGGPEGRIRRYVGDPLLLATIMWAAAHLFVRSDALHVLLFAGFLVWAIFDLFAAQSRRTAAADVPAPLEGATPWIADGVALVGGLALYVAFMVFLHQWLFGVSPIG